MSLTKNADYELKEAINDIEDYIEWLNEDLFQGEITQNEYDIMLENYNGTLKHLKYVLNNLKTN
tara:strand:- start:117 stop:308 length:192 start_codon:yes stop_codon:yes gene_type:complete